MSIHRIKNWILLYLGFTLKNKHKNYVMILGGVQYQNTRYARPYKMDDPDWKILWRDIPDSVIKRMRDCNGIPLIQK